MSFVDERWPRALAWISVRGVRNATLGVVGVPFNRSVTPGKYDAAPVAIRQALDRFSTYDFESGRDVAELVVCDYKNIHADNHRMTETVDSMMPAFEPAVTCILGGDNGATRAGVQAMAKALGVGLDKVGLVTLDAHLDLRDLHFGSMNGNPIRGLIKDGLPGSNIHQIGLQSFSNSGPYAQDAKEFGIQMKPIHLLEGAKFMEAVEAALNELSSRVAGIYVDVDLDVLDVAYAPGCPGSRPGGVTPRQLRQAVRLCGKHQKVRCLDIVELDTLRDVNDQTALLAAALFLEFATGVLLRN